MGRQRTPIGTFGEISYVRAGRKIRARTRYRDDDGRIRRVQASGATEADAVRRLKAALAQRESRRSYGELSPDSSFTALVKVWLEDLDLDGELAQRSSGCIEARWSSRRRPLLRPRPGPHRRPGRPPPGLRRIARTSPRPSSRGRRAGSVPRPVLPSRPRGRTPTRRPES